MADSQRHSLVNKLSASHKNTQSIRESTHHLSLHAVMQFGDKLLSCSACQICLMLYSAVCLFIYFTVISL